MKRKFGKILLGTIYGLYAIMAVLAFCACLVVSGCASTANKVTQSASVKNLNLDGYVMLGELETANPETATPQGRMILGRVTYKSRKVGIPADQKVPTAGYFKATKTTSLFGVEEQIIEYDFTAGSDADAKAAETLLKAKQAEAEKAFAKASEAQTAEKPDDTTNTKTEKSEPAKSDTAAEPAK